MSIKQIEPTPELIALINSKISQDVMDKFQINANYIAVDVMKTKIGFELDETPEKIFEDECAYYIRYGQNAFDTGYCGADKQDKLNGTEIK